MIAITFALPAESSDFVRLLEKPALNSREGVETIRGQLHGKSVAVIHTGVGRKSCRERMEILLRRERFEYLISAGFAGALEKELRSRESAALGKFFEPGAPAVASVSICADDGIFLGKLLTVSGMVDSNAERDRWRRRRAPPRWTWKRSSSRRRARIMQLPMLSLRAISDTPSEPFPAPPHVLFDLEKQKTDFARLALYLVTASGRAPAAECLSAARRPRAKAPHGARSTESCASIFCSRIERCGARCR